MMSTQSSKHAEAYNKCYYKARICALSWLISKIILRYWVSKTSKSGKKDHYSLKYDNNNWCFT